MSNIFKFFIAIAVLALVFFGARQYLAKEAVAPAPETPTTGQKLNIQEVCQSALMYTTFPDGASADAFVAACINGEHPEVIERYKSDMGLGDGAAI